MEAALFITICLMTVIAAATAGLFARGRNPKTLVAGIGLVVLPLGLYLSGVTQLAYNGVLSLIDWAQRTVWTDTMTWGAGLAGFGIVLLVVAGFMKTKARPRQQRVRAEQPNPAAADSKPSQQAAVGAASAAPTTAAPQPKGGKPPAMDPEDAEIEALLRKRGIM